MPQKVKKADLPQISANPQPQAGLVKRQLTTIRLYQSWLIYDLLGKELLCTYNESHISAGLYVKVFEPISFKKLNDAEEFIDGKITIADIQERLSTLKVMYSSALCL